MAEVKGQGTLLKVDISSTFTTIAQRVEITGPELTQPKIDATDLDDTSEQSCPGLFAGGALQMTIHYDTAQTTHKRLTTGVRTGVTESWKLVFSDTTEWAFSGYLTRFKPMGMSRDNLVKAEIEIQVTGAVTVPT